MNDSMDVMRQLKQINEQVVGLRQMVSSNLDLQSKMLNCESEVNSPQLNSDFAVGNLDVFEMRNILLDFDIGRQCFAMGATRAGMSFFHAASEKATLSRSKNGFMPKIIRTTISQSSAKVTEESGGFRLGRSREV